MLLIFNEVFKLGLAQAELFGAVLTAQTGIGGLGKPLGMTAQGDLPAQQEQQ